ncbi:MAG TPA: ISL3 family transposase [Actinomycetales bacterium]|jgi:transposase|nr:ISL3 family transposase [Mycobacteriales bacterium]HEX5534969.1 ISL3 family transposase [Actinomycetales bacterium]
MPDHTVCCARTSADGYCVNCDLLVGLPGVRVVAVAGGRQRLTVTVESPRGPMGCPACGVVAVSHGRRTHVLIDTPCFGRPVRLHWRKRTWSCPEPACAVGTFTERAEDVAAPRALLSTRARWWAVRQLRREHASVAGLARQLGTTWRTVWRSVKPLLEMMADDESRFGGVSVLGVDEHVWHHVSTKPATDGGRGPKELTGMVDLSRDRKGKTRARLLDLVPGRSGAVYAQWLRSRNDAFRAGVQVATLDPFHGYKNALDDELEDAIAVLDAFHIVKLGTHAVDEVRRRVQQEIHGHRGRSGDPLYGIRNVLRCGEEKLTDKQKTRLAKAFTADERHVEVEVAWRCAQQLRTAYNTERLSDGRKIAEQVLASFPTCPIPEIKRLGKTLKQWREAFLAYFETRRASNGGTEAINGLIELHRRIARGFRNRDNYRLRMLLIGGGLSHPNLS